MSTVMALARNLASWRTIRRAASPSSSHEFIWATAAAEPHQDNPIHPPSSLSQSNATITAPRRRHLPCPPGRGFPRCQSHRKTAPPRPCPRPRLRPETARVAPAHRERSASSWCFGSPPDHQPKSCFLDRAREPKPRAEEGPPWRRRGRRAAIRTCHPRRRPGWRPRFGTTSTASRPGAPPSRRAATRRRMPARNPMPSMLGTTTCRSSASCATSRRSPRSELCFSFPFTFLAQ
jgi:hypothetical protein